MLISDIYPCPDHADVAHEIILCFILCLHVFKNLLFNIHHTCTCMLIVRNVPLFLSGY